MTDHFVLPSGTIAPTAPFGTSATPQSPTSGSTLGGRTTGSTNTYAFPTTVSSGVFMIVGTSFYSAGGTMHTDTFAFTNCSSVDLVEASSVFSMSTGPDAFLNEGAVAPQNVISLLLFVKVTASPASFTWSNASTYGTTGVGADFIVTQLPNTIN